MISGVPPTVKARRGVPQAMLSEECLPKCFVTRGGEGKAGLLVEVGGAVGVRWV